MGVQADPVNTFQNCTKVRHIVAFAPRGSIAAVPRHLINIPSSPNNGPTVSLTAQCMTAGCACRVQLVSVAEKFQELLKARLHGDQSLRDQIPQLCLGLCRVRVVLENTTDVNNAIAALAYVNPLQPIWKDVQKKSRVQHVMCDMLNSMLAPAANEGPSVFFYSFISSPAVVFFLVFFCAFCLLCLLHVSACDTSRKECIVVVLRDFFEVEACLDHSL